MQENDRGIVLRQKEHRAGWLAEAIRQDAFFGCPPLQQEEQGGVTFTFLCWLWSDRGQLVMLTGRSSSLKTSIVRHAGPRSLHTGAWSQ